MLKQIPSGSKIPSAYQPPSGGCVLKRREAECADNKLAPAAFRRLCVETRSRRRRDFAVVPAAFRRLCVETARHHNSALKTAPAAFRRLCVETQNTSTKKSPNPPAAFRRLCVETMVESVVVDDEIYQPPSGGCVLKLCKFDNQQEYQKPAAFRRLCVETAEYADAEYFD